MVKVNESVQITEAEIKTAISEWLQRQLGHEYTVTLHHSKSTTGQGWAEVDHEHFSATANRQVQNAQQKKA